MGYLDVADVWNTAVVLVIQLDLTFMLHWTHDTVFAVHSVQLLVLRQSRRGRLTED